MEMPLTAKEISIDIFRDQGIPPAGRRRMARIFLQAEPWGDVGNSGLALWNDPSNIPVSNASRSHFLEC